MDLAKLRAQLVKHEGLRLLPYVDTVGKLTIGVGHNLTDNGLTAMQCMFILDDDVKDTINFLTTHCPWWATLDEVRQRAIADLAFNLKGKLLEFKNMIAAIQAKDWGKASTELLNSKFATQTGTRAADLAAQLLTGKD